MRPTALQLYSHYGICRAIGVMWALLWPGSLLATA